MENNRGVLSRPSDRRGLVESEKKIIGYRENKRPIFAIGILSVLLIVSYMFTMKIYEPARNILITGSILVYPLTFLVIAYVSKYYGFKEARRSIFVSAIMFIVFMLLVMICLIPTANNATASFNMVIQYIFANDFVNIGDFTLYYPILGQFFGLIVAYIVSHLLYATVYNAIHNITVDYLAMGLSIFIGYVIDRIIFMPLLYAENLISKANTFEHFIKCLTSEFMGAILSSLLVIIVYIVISTIKDRKKKKSV